jgi:hypothetical protein
MSGFRRCYPKCYNARSRECRCICGGANHGAGGRQAYENGRESGLSWSPNPKRQILPARSRKSAVPKEQGKLFPWLNPSGSY